MASVKQQVVIVALAAVALGGFFAFRKYLAPLRPPFGQPPAGFPALLPPEAKPAAPGPGEVNETAMPLKLPAGFSISIFAQDLPGARVVRVDDFGNMWVSRTSQGKVTRLEIKDGRVVGQRDVFDGLRKPHGLAFDPDDPQVLYVAEEHRLQRYRLGPGGTLAGTGETVLPLPSGDGHFTRTIGFGPDWKLYISVGSSCNVCNESDQRRAAILRYDPGTRQSEIFARGLRNAVFFTWHPVSGALWATEMGRDWLGDELPPDEINIVEQGRDYGWPDCYGKNVPDPFGLERPSNPCAGKRPSVIDIPAHSAPLGLTFIPPNSHWPEEYWYDLLVSYHGSWNRSRPTGYKVVRHRFDSGGNYQGVEDFITGWLPQDVLGDGPDASLGRPVDILIQPGGIMYLSDDKAGVIYKVTWRGQP